jgi:serine protease Do
MKSNSGKFSVKFFVGILTFGIILGIIGAYYFGSLDFLKKLSPSKSTSSVIIKSFPPSFADLVDTVSPAVVNISTTKMAKSPDFFGDPQSPFEEFSGRDFWEKFFGRKLPQQKQRSLGSGFIVAKEGYIITNAHVVEEADQITIRLANEKTYEAEVVGRDEKTDLALIKAKTWVDFPEPIKLGDSNKLRVGDWVMAIGNPFGLDHTVTAGIVSAKGKAIGAGPYDDFIQTDASINPGNSGGPLFNIQGEVVGINSLIYTTTGGNIGIGFAVPINMAKEIMEQLTKQGKVTRGWMGVSIQRLTPELAETFGVKDLEGALITDVIPGSPADKAGLKKGDIVVECNNKKINRINDFSRLIGTIPIGESVKLIVVRDREKKSFIVTVKEKEEIKKLTPEKMGPDIGIQVEELTPEAAQNFGYPETEQGVIIFQVDPGSVADEAGLKPGDVIKEVNRKPVNSLKDYRDAIKDSSLQEGILFFVTRKQGSFFVVVKEQ